MRKLNLPDLRPVHPVRLQALVMRFFERERTKKADSRPTKDGGRP
jgi:hypothetical protein